MTHNHRKQPSRPDPDSESSFFLEKEKPNWENSKRIFIERGSIFNQSFNNSFPPRNKKRLIQASYYNYKHEMAENRLKIEPSSITHDASSKVNSIHVVPATGHGPSDPLPRRLNRARRGGTRRVNENGRFSKGKGRIVRGQFRKGDLSTAPPIKRARPHRGNSSSTRS